jgi:phage terminase large subunit GpA-like protein
VSLKYGLIDDFEAAKSKSKESGNTRKLMEGRFAAYKDTHKIFYISTPELKINSNIEPAYLLGDQRKYMVPCPCCGVFIELRWNVPDGIGTVWDAPLPEGTGIVWDYDADGSVKDDSVGYVCQECRKFFDDSHKMEMLQNGYWQPTAKPSQPGYFSYHISSLYAPVGMYDWKHYVHNYIEANPKEQPRKEDEYKTFLNTCLGITFEPSGEAPKATAIQRNCRTYSPGTVPEQQSIKDGNGRIVLLTCAIDMNGIMKDTQDVRLDYEVKAWSAEGASYSVIHGSIGTFQRGIGKDTTDRKKWTYEDNKENSVWPELEKVIDSIFQTDTPSQDSPTGYRRMKIQLAGLDCGNFTSHAYAFLDKTTLPIVGLKGRDEGKYIREGVDTPIFSHGLERRQDYILKVGLIKDKLVEYMGLNWDREKESQPSNFMNFPEPSDGLYRFDNYFEHYESEEKKLVTDKNGQISFKWDKKGSHVQNHMFDCAVYNIALRDIVVNIYSELTKQKGLQWRDYVRAVLG